MGKDITNVGCLKLNDFMRGWIENVIIEPTEVNDVRKLAKATSNEESKARSAFIAYILDKNLVILTNLLKQKISLKKLNN
jgi:hypothetical protein